MLTDGQATSRYDIQSRSFEYGSVFVQIDTNKLLLGHFSGIRINQYRTQIFTNMCSNLVSAAQVYALFSATGILFMVRVKIIH
jgi:hypothetical protein